MYQVDERDRVTTLQGLPRSSPGSPCPVLLASEHQLSIAYYLAQNSGSADDEIAVVRFARPYAFSGHPLAQRGLRPYGAFVVEQSSWIRRYEQMNAVHPRHDPARFADYRHFVLSFHDSIFECIAHDFTAEVTSAASMSTIISREVAGATFE